MNAAVRLLLMSGVALPTGAMALLAGESSGLAIDFSLGLGLGQVAVKGHTTNLNNVAADDFLTNSGTSPKLVMWSDGLLRWTPHNMVVRSENFGTTWTTTNGTVSSTTQFRETTTNGSHFLAQGATTLINGATYCVEVDAAPVGRDWIFIQHGSGFSGTFFDITNGVVGSQFAGTGTVVSASMVSQGGGVWRCRLAFTTASASGDLRIWSTTADGNVSNFAGDTAKGFNITRVHLNRGTVPTTYLATTTAARYGVPIEYSSGAFAMLAEPQATNLALRGRDFSNASWTKSNLTAARTATGPDGVANSASTLTATAGNATALQAITSASSSRLTHMYVKRRTGSGQIEMTQDNGSTWTPVTVTSSWTRVQIAAATATDPTVGIRIVTSGDAIDVDLFQHETGAVATSGVPSFAATVTRAADADNAPLTAIPFSATVGTVYVKGKTPKAASAAVLLSLDDGTGNERIRITYTGTNINIQITDGGASQLAPIDLGAVAVDTAYQVTFAWEANSFAASLNGGAVVTDASGTLPTVTTLRIGYSPAGEQGVTRFDKLIYVPRRVADGSLPAWRYAA